MAATLERTGSAARAVEIPVSTRIALERRGVVGPFQRDAAGRRLISEEDLKRCAQILKRATRRLP
jgi:DNA-binding transcriptional MerR regulator